MGLINFMLLSGRHQIVADYLKFVPRVTLRGRSVHFHSLSLPHRNARHEQKFTKKQSNMKKCEFAI